MTARCVLRLSPSGARHTLTFEISHDASVPVTWGFFAPFMDFRLTARDPQGRPVVIDQPPLDTPVQPQTLTVQPRAVGRLVSAAQLQFDPSGSPAIDDPFVWRVRHAAEGVVLRAQLDLRGPAVPACEAAVKE